MKNKIRMFVGAVLLIGILGGCGKDTELEQFKVDIDSFCTNVSNIDTAINSLDVNSESAVSDMLALLDELNTEFQQFAELDFPEQFDYLEELADEAGDYMAEAVSSYRDAYTNDTYDESMFTAMYQYARENESRAFKRVQIIITFLHGEEPDAVGLTTTEPSAAE
ncbi:MAG: hypothetical protein NC417_12660 [Candidatus Gastranaerophilales bacterium]|nr:hypothetical protein [Candidatus Gastranaerophilales bacterium]